MRRGAALALGLALAAPATASAAPMGSGAGPVGVYAIDGDRAGEHAAKTLTNVLRQQILDAPDHTLGGESPLLLLTARDLRCRVVSSGEWPFDDACLKKLGRFLGMPRFFWGFVSSDGGRLVVRLHLWQEGKPDRVAELPYDAAARGRLVARLYRKLVTPESVGDVSLSGDASGELAVDGRDEGPYAPGVELTLPAGERAIEVRRGDRVVARARVAVEAGGRAEARLEPVVEAAPAPPPGRMPSEPPATVVRPRASAWPWVLGGVGVAGLAGAGVFWGLRSSARADLDGACAGRACLPSERGAADRASHYRTLSAVSLGVGVAAGAGLAAYLLTPGKRPPVSGAVVPVAGGAAVGVGGSF